MSHLLHCVLESSIFSVRQNLNLLQNLATDGTNRQSAIKLFLLRQYQGFANFAVKFWYVVSASDGYFKNISFHSFLSFFLLFFLFIYLFNFFFKNNSY